MPLRPDADPARHFQPSYRVSRERLLERAHALSDRLPVHVDTRPISPLGPDGETLALDFVVFGARAPRRALVVSSATHGVEGYTGSALQHWMLDELLPRVRLDDDTAVVIQHANNPYGFAWHRRVNENNVDFNRNFADAYDPDRCDPDYVRMHDDINPPDLAPQNETQRRARFDAYIAEHGLRRFQQAVIGGQYRFPHGVQFGGDALQPGAAHLLALVREHLSRAELVAWVDVHTGLGPFGDCELITGAASDSDSYRASNEVFPGHVHSASSGESVSTPLNGLLDRGLERAMPAGCRFAFCYPEYGTYDPMRIILAMRADNWLHNHGDPHAALRAGGPQHALKTEMLEAFRPDSREWERRIVEHGADLIETALSRIPGARIAGAN